MAFTDDQIQKIWEKAATVSGNDSNVYRKDQCGAWISKKNYGNRESEYGWEIDHIKPISNGGGDEISNLRPLHWQNNISKSDGKLSCVVTSSGVKNVKV